MKQTIYAALKLVPRTLLALKFYTRLNYSWRTAWYKAQR